MSAATMPERAAGKTIRSETCSLEAPSPNAPSRSEAGTADIASSATDAIVGRTSRPRMMPADRALNWLTSNPSAAEDVRREVGEGEVAEDDGRDAGQRLEDRLDHLAHPRRRVLGEVDRAQQPERDRHEQADAGQVERPPDERQTPKDCWSPRSSGVHLVAEQVVADRHVAEEGDRLPQQREDDQRPS